MADYKWSEQLPQRLPHYYQNTNLTDTYVKSVGEFYDEVVEFIESLDHIQDYKLSRTKYLPELQKKFGIEPDCALPIDRWREMIRDIDKIIRTRGTLEAVRWAFGMAGWDAIVEEAWLVNPELYDSRIMLYFPDVYANFDEHQDADVIFNKMRYGEEYIYGKDKQMYKYHFAFMAKEKLRFGGSSFYRINTSQNNLIINHVTPGNIEIKPGDKVTPQNFMYGEAYDDDDGVWFRGHTLYNPSLIYERMPIVGGRYLPGTIDPTVPPVMSTPYIVVRIQKGSEIIPMEYVDVDGETRVFSEEEQLVVTSEIVDFFVNNFVRPTNVRILAIVSDQFEVASICAKSKLSIELIGDGKVSLGRINDKVSCKSSIDMMRIGNNVVQTPRVGDGLVCGAPSYSNPIPFNSVPMPKLGESVNISEFVFNHSTATFNYGIEFQYVGSEIQNYDNFSNDFTFSQNKTYTQGIALRSPSNLIISQSGSSPSSTIVDIMGRDGHGGDLRKLGDFELTSNGQFIYNGNQTNTLQLNNINGIVDIFLQINIGDINKINQFDISVSVSWLNQALIDYNQIGI